MRVSRFIPAALFSMLFALSQQSGQHVAPTAVEPEQPLLRMNVNLVQVDATVTDSKGNRVTNLKATDFEILQDGKPQKITHFSYVPVPPRLATAPAQLANPAASGPVGSRRPMVSDVRRTIALVVDDLALSFANSDRVRHDVEKFVSTVVQPGDLVAVIRTSSGMSALQQFTTDKRVLLAAVKQIKFSLRNRVGIDSFPAIRDQQRTPGNRASTSMGKEVSSDAEAAMEREIDSAKRARQRFDRVERDLFGAGTVNTVRQALESLQGLPGRKSLVLISENLVLPPGSSDGSIMFERLRSVVDLANRTGVIVYAVDPRSAPFLGFTAADDVVDDPRNADPYRLLQLRDNRRNYYLDSRVGLGFLAEETGGRFLSGGEVVERLTEAAEDQLGYYLLGYRPESGTFAEDSLKLKYHSVKVSLKRQGLKIRSRHGFLGLSDETSAAAPANPVQRLIAALNSPLRSDDIRLRLTSMFDVSAQTGPAVLSMVHINANDLRFTDEADGWKVATLTLVTMAYGAEGKVNEVQAQTFRIRAKGPQYEDIMRRGFIHTVTHPLKKAGMFQFRVAVGDAQTDRVGAATEFLDVPDTTKDRLALSGILLMSREAREADVGENGMTRFTEGHAAIRRFRPGQQVRYEYKVLNASENDAAPELDSAVLLYRDGVEVFRSPARPVATTGAGKTRRLLVGGELKLIPRFVPGDYELQVLVRDRRARGGKGLASSSIDFEVVGAEAEEGQR